MNSSTFGFSSSLAIASLLVVVVGCGGEGSTNDNASTSATESPEPANAQTPRGGACQAPAGTYSYALRDMEGGGHIAAYLAACGPQGNPAAMKELITSSHLLGEGLGPLCEVTTRSTSPDGCTFTYETACREQICTTEITFAGDAYTGTVDCHQAESFPEMKCAHRIYGAKKP